MTLGLDGAARDLLAELAATPLVDHHVHGAFRAAPSRAAYGDALNEADTDPLLPDVDPFDSQVGFAVRAWCAPLLGLDRHASPDDYWARRSELGEDEVNRRFLAAAGVSDWLVDTGHRADDLLTPTELAATGGGRAHEVVRLESLAESLVADGIEPTAYAAAFRTLLAERARGGVAVKSVLAYRAGFDVDLSRPSDAQVEHHVAAWLRDVARTGSVRLTDPRLIAFGIHEAAELGLPLQLHVGLGDRDMDLRRSDPLLLTDLLRLPEIARVPVMLLHCYPFERQAGYLAQAFRNVFLDVGLSVNFIGARATALVARSLELAPFGQVLYSSDACGPSELHFLGARLWRNAIARVVGGFVDADEWSAVDASRVVRMIARDNAVRAYGLPATGS
ncbi:amidohydrolase [Terrabacter sp. Soil811]|uniref:amidohydrolase family protein n=1 Tax=Terrabacter sp. Soil811 TaxID=1736419 RepID=UPI0006F41E7A|nr:amidohydrolase family protein [Terrabacter sp. Soil811]KRF39924.1 amidohydrolase [Terrabacter sp. Soil811]